MSQNLFRLGRNSSRNSIQLGSENPFFLETFIIIIDDSFIFIFSNLTVQDKITWGRWQHGDWGSVSYVRSQNRDLGFRHSGFLQPDKVFLDDGVK